MHLNMEDCRGEVYPTGRIVFLGPAWQAEWLATWPGIKALNARCKCKEFHRKLGATTPDGMWTGNLQLLAESAAYPKRLGEALLASWAQGSTAIAISGSNAAL